MSLFDRNTREPLQSEVQIKTRIKEAAWRNRQYQWQWQREAVIRAIGGAKDWADDYVNSRYDTVLNIFMTRYRGISNRTWGVRRPMSPKQVSRRFDEAGGPMAWRKRGEGRYCLHLTEFYQDMFKRDVEGVRLHKIVTILSWGRQEPIPMEVWLEEATDLYLQYCESGVDNRTQQDGMEVSLFELNEVDGIENGDIPLDNDAKQQGNAHSYDNGGMFVSDSDS